MALEVEPISHQQGNKQKILILFFVVAFFFAYGVIDARDVFYPKLASIVNGAVIPIFVATSISWCAIERRMNGQILGFWWIFGMFFAAPILLPAFFFKERGWRRGAIFTAKFVVLNLLLILVAALGSVTGKYVVAT